MTWPSWTSMGTSRWLEKAIASLSLKRQGMRRASTPLCANAIRTFQQCGLKRSKESAPANPYSVRSEESREGKEWLMTCKCRGCTDHLTKNKFNTVVESI